MRQGNNSLTPRSVDNRDRSDAVPAASHTPGPWSIHTEYESPHRHIVMNDAMQQRVCLVPQYAEVDHFANARLIAAAPTMKTALLNAEELIVNLIGMYGDGGAGLVLAEIRAAIAKAEGR